MVNPFNTDGFNSIRGFAIVSRRMVVSAHLVFPLLQMATMDQTLALAKALETFRKHAVKAHHKFAILQADDFKKVMENQWPAIQHVMNQAMADQVASSRQKLASVLKVIVLCGRQNIALRGHCDNITDLESDTLTTENHGNFWAL